MSQTKLQSAVEAVANIAVGYSINLAGNMWVLPALGHDVSFYEANVIGVFFTLISFARSFALRRFYNWLHNPMRVK